MEQKRSNQTECKCNGGKEKCLLYEGTVSMHFPRVHPVLLPCLLAPVLPELTAHNCEEEDQPPLLGKRPVRNRLLFDQNMHYQHLLQASTLRLQEELEQNMRRYQNEKAKLQEQLAMLHNELTENQSTTSARSDHSISKDYNRRSQQTVTYGANNSEFDTKNKSLQSKMKSVPGRQSSNYFNHQLWQASYRRKSTFKGSKNTTEIRNSYPSNQNQKGAQGLRKTNDKRQQSSFNLPKYLPPVGIKSSLKKAEWQSGQYLDPRVPNKGCQTLAPISKAIMDYKDKGRRILVSRQSSFGSSESLQTKSSLSRQSYISDQSESRLSQVESVFNDTPPVSNRKKHPDKFKAKNFEDATSLKLVKTNLRQHLENQLENKMRAVAIDTENQTAGATQVTSEHSLSLPRRKKQDENTTEGLSSYFNTSETYIQQPGNVFDEDSIDSSDNDDFNEGSLNTLYVPQVEILNELRNNSAPAVPREITSKETPLVSYNDTTTLPYIRKPLGLYTRKNLGTVPVSKLVKSNPDLLPKLAKKGLQSDSHKIFPRHKDEYERAGIFPKVASKNSKFVVPRITVRPASKTGELERLKSLLDLKTANPTLPKVSMKHEDPAVKWKALYMKITDPTKRSQMLSDIVFAVREKMRENEHQLKYGINPKSLITHNTLCDFLLFKPQNNNRKPMKKPQKLMPLATHTAERSVRRSTSSQLQEFLRRSVKNRPMIEHLQAEEYRLVHYGEKRYFNDK